MTKAVPSNLALALAGVTLWTLAALPPARADWPACGRPIVTSTAGQVHSVIAADGANGAIIAWQDERSPRINILAHHVLASGDLDPTWPGDGRALLNDPVAIANAAGGQTTPLIVPDGAGGAIVAWQDLRSAATETDIFAQHILASGVVDRAWPPNGAALCAIEGVQNAHAMTSDGAGGAIVTWMDGRPGASVKDIYAQHVLASGVVDPAWPLNGIAVSTAPGLQELPAIVGDGSGGAIITWDDGRSATTRFDVYAQHVLASGVLDPAWPAGGLALCSAAGDQGGPTIVSDGGHGAIVAWSDSRIVGTAHIFAQHALASGVVDEAWPVNGRAISGAAVSEGRARAIPDGAGGAIVNWQGFTVELNMYIQHVTATGIVDPAWPAGGLALSDSDVQQTFADIVTDGRGGAIVAWNDSLDIVVQHVLASGALDPTYPVTGRELCTLSGEEGDVALVATGGAGAIAAWTDTRNGKDADIYALQVLEAGTVDVEDSAPSGITFARPIPNPTRDALTLRFALPREAEVRLAIYDLTGRRVRDLASGARPAGEHAIAWDLRNDRGDPVRAGLYFARLDVERDALTRKLMTLR